MYRVDSGGSVDETIDMWPLGYGAIARSVNCFGQVVGIGHDGETYVSFLWSIDSGLDAILGPYNSACVSARDINCFGEVAARDCNAQGVATGGRYLRLDEGHVVETIELGDFFPRKINQFGVMAGYSMDEDEMKLPAICYLDEDRIPHVTVLGWPDGFSGRAYDINNQSQVVGYQRALNPEGVWSSRAFLWSVADGMRDLGDLGGGYATAWAIDEAGEVTGESVVRKRNGSLVPRAFVWRDGVMSDLNELSDTNFTLMRAYAMNNDGQIVVEGHDRTGKKALLLTPTAP